MVYLNTDILLMTQYVSMNKKAAYSAACSFPAQIFCSANRILVVPTEKRVTLYNMARV